MVRREVFLHAGGACRGGQEKFTSGQTAYNDLIIRETLKLTVFPGDRMQPNCTDIELLPQLRTQ